MLHVLRDKKGMTGHLLNLDNEYPASPFAETSIENSFSGVEKLNAQVEDFLKVGDLEKALVLLDKAITINSNDSCSRFNRAGIYWMNGEFEQAFKDISKAIDLGFENWDVYYMLGNIEMSREFYDQALNAFQKACELDPDNLEYPASLLGLGASLSSLGRHDEALRCLTDVLEKKPHKWDLANAHYWLGVSHFEMAEFEKGEEYLLKAVELMPDSSIPYNDLGYCLVEQGKYEQALEPLKKSLELEPSVDSFCNIAKAYIRLGQHEEAQESIEKATELSPDNPTVHSVHGDFFRLNNQPEEAKIEYLKSIQIVEGKPKRKRERNDYRAVVISFNGLSKLDEKHEIGLVAEAIERKKLSQEMVQHLMS